VLYGRRSGRRLRAGRRALVENLLPGVEIATLDAGAKIDPHTLFPGSPRDIWLEIGFGAGEHLAWQAARHPDMGFIGCEPFINGVARLLTAIEADGLNNIRIFRDDATALLAALPSRSIRRAFLLFPDPWPKTRHHKRRFISPANLALLARVSDTGTELRVATDDPGYQAWIMEHVLRSGAFEWLARRPGDWRTRPADWPATRYEEKAVKSGRRPVFFRFRRRPHGANG
jgi:tRNA (guanine-N7-)-methyltransferase